MEYSFNDTWLNQVKRRKTKMASSTKDPFSPTIPGNVAGSASREGLAGTRPYVKEGAQVGRDSGTSGLGRQTSGNPPSGMSGSWLPLSDMTDKPITPNAGDGLIDQVDANASAKLATSRDALGQNPNFAKAETLQMKGNSVSDEGRALYDSIGMAVGNTTIKANQGLGQGSASKPTKTKGTSLNRTTGRPDKRDVTQPMDD
jgi:hypothetical protein